MVWNKNYPLSTSVVSASTDQIRDNWSAIEDILAVEHYTLTSTVTGGQHRLGETGIVFYGTSAQIAALSEPGTGALSLDSSLGMLKMYRDGGWESISKNKFSRIRAIGPDDQTIPHGTWTPIHYSSIESTTSSGAFDTLSEYNSDNYTVTITGTTVGSNAGYFLISGNATFPDTVSNSGANYSKGLAIYINDVSTSFYNTFGSREQTIEIIDIRNLLVSNTIRMMAYQNSGSSILLTSCNFNCVRVS